MSSSTHASDTGCLLIGVNKKLYEVVESYGG